MLRHAGMARWALLFAHTAAHHCRRVELVIPLGADSTPLALSTAGLLATDNPVSSGFPGPESGWVYSGKGARAQATATAPDKYRKRHAIQATSYTATSNYIYFNIVLRTRIRETRKQGGGGAYIQRF